MRHGAPNQPAVIDLPASGPIDPLLFIAGVADKLQIDLLERMVPLDEQTVALIDRICAHRSPGRPCPIPAPHGPPSSCSPTNGRRVTVYQLRGVLTRVAHDAGLPPPPRTSCATPHRPGQRRCLAAIV